MGRLVWTATALALVLALLMSGCAQEKNGAGMKNITPANEDGTARGPASVDANRTPAPFSVNRSPPPARPKPAPIEVDYESYSIYNEQLGSNVTVRWHGPDFSNRTRARWGASPDGLARMRVFIDYQCPYSGKMRSVLFGALAKHPEVVMEYRHLILPQMAYSRQAALGAECAGDEGKFWEMSDAIFDDRQNLTLAKLHGLAAGAGVRNLSRWDTCVVSQWHSGVLDADAAEAGALGLRNTPTFVMGNRTLKGLASDEEFEAFVLEGLAGPEQS